MKKIILLVALVLIAASLFASDYCTGTVKNNEGGIEDAGVYMCFWNTNYGWINIDSCHNNPIDGSYSLDFADGETSYNLRVSAYIDDHDVTIHKYFWWSGGSIVVNFVYTPGNQN